MSKRKARKRALLLHYSGEEVNDLFDTLPDTGEDNDYKEACEALTRYFTPKKNVSFEIFKFRNLKQESHETVDEFSYPFADSLKVLRVWRQQGKRN